MFARLIKRSVCAFSLYSVAQVMKAECAALLLVCEGRTIVDEILSQQKSLPSVNYAIANIVLDVNSLQNLAISFRYLRVARKLSQKSSSVRFLRNGRCPGTFLL
jgi:hypothetical protein